MNIKRLWTTLSDVGLQEDLNIFEQRKIRILNQTSLNAMFCCLMTVLIYKVLGYPAFTWVFIGTIISTSIPIWFNYYRLYNWSKAVFILNFTLIELLLAYCLGRASYMEFCILLLPISAVLLFNEDNLKMNIAFCLIGVGGFLMCELIYAYTSPIIILPNPLVYKIIVGITLSLTVFQNVRFFKLNLLDIYALNRKQNTDLEQRQIHISQQNSTLKQINQRLLTKIKHKTRIEKELLMVNKELQQFTSMASHDMKEPLRTISSFSDLLEEQISKDKEAQEFLFYIKDAAERMTCLLNDLISFARVGKNPEAMTDIDLNDIILIVKKNLHTHIEQKKAVIYCKNLPMIEGHITPFIQLFQNIISNSIKYQRRQQQAIVHIDYQAATENYIISVTDNGIGIAPKDRKRIFEPFTRLHSSKDYKGSGIGLATCMKIIQRYKGEIWVESEVGKGSTFYISLPKSQEDIKQTIKKKEQILCRN